MFLPHCKALVSRGFQTYFENYQGNYWPFSKAGTCPAVIPVQPSFGDLDTGRSGLPFFTPGLTPLIATSPKTLLGTLVQAGRDFPSLTPGLTSLTATSPNAFGDPGTGRSGLPFFTPGLTPLIATSPKRFREPWYRQAGTSLFNTRARSARRNESDSGSGSFGTGRPKMPFFIPLGD